MTSTTDNALRRALDAAKVLRARWLNDGHGLGERDQLDFRLARNEFDTAFKEYKALTASHPQGADDWRAGVEAAIHEAAVYGIGATSDRNQNVILQFAKEAFRNLQPPVSVEATSAGRDDKVEAWNLIETLRAPEGHSVTLFCDNPDFNEQPNCAVEVCGDWTEWEQKRFVGETILDALRDAHDAMREHADALFESED